MTGVARIIRVTRISAVRSFSSTPGSSVFKTLGFLGEVGVLAGHLLSGCQIVLHLQPGFVGTHHGTQFGVTTTQLAQLVRVGHDFGLADPSMDWYSSSAVAAAGNCSSAITHFLLYGAVLFDYSIAQVNAATKLVKEYKNASPRSGMPEHAKSNRTGVKYATCSCASEANNAATGVKNLLLAGVERVALKHTSTNM